MHNSKKIWEGIKEIIHNRFNRDNSEIYLDEEGNIITNQKTVANRFNKFYTNVAKNLLAKLGKTPTKFQDYLKNPNEHSIFLNETNPDEITDIVKKLDTTKAGDIYGTTPKLVKWAGSALSQNLSIIFNLAMETGVFPQLLKNAKVIPVHKGDSKMITSNYRPISLLPIFGKMFEKIIYIRVMSFVEKYNIIYEKQYGFQPGKATEHAVIDIQDNVLDSLEKKENPCCVFLDFAKAFDTVNHDILLAKLHHYGIRGSAHNLIKSYLTDREQCVQLNDALSDMDTISHGVPQGSILGPLFFLLYINDIAQSSDILTFYLFADDTAIFYSHKNISTLEEVLNRELVHVSNWLIANKLSLNIKKSNALLFRTKNQAKSAKINLVLDGIAIEETESAKYLGVILDHKFTYENHIKQVKSKLIKGNAILAKVRHFIPPETLRNTYFAYIQPHLDYGLILWGYAAKSHLADIVRQQKKAIRIINFKHKYHESAPLFKESKILPLDKNLQLNSSKIIWKSANSVLPTSVASIFQQREESDSFYVPFRRIDVTQNCITYRGVQNYNKLPSEIKSCKTLDTFKDKYKEHLLEQL